MVILALDSATATARVAVLDESARVLAAREATATRHSSNLLRLCHEVLSETSLTPASLAAVACGAGPGTFTGLRVGLAVAKGLLMPTGASLLLVSSLAALALDIFDASGGDDGDAAALAVACIDAGKGAVHVGIFRRDDATLVAPVGPSALLMPDAVPPHLVAATAAGQRLTIAGNGADRYGDALLGGASPATWHRVEVAGPSALAVGRLGLGRHLRGEADDLDSAVPLYGRAPDITVKKTPAK